jgi:hypothetical protein
MATNLTIGELARQADVAATTLRYYERIGLLHSLSESAASAATTSRSWLALR